MTDHIRKKINTRVQMGTCLSDIIKEIEVNDFSGRFCAAMEQSYVNYKFLKYGLKYWLEFVKLKISSMDSDQLVGMMTKMENARSLKDIPEEFKTSVYFNNIVNSGLLPENSNDNLEVVHRLKMTWWKTALESCNSLKNETTVVNCLAQALTDPTFYNFKKEFINYFRLHETNTASIELEDILEYILKQWKNSTEIVELGEASQKIEKVKISKFLRDRAKSIVMVYTSKPKIKIESNAVIVTGNDIGLSSVIPEVEGMLGLGSCKEVRIFAAGMVYVDRSIEGELWRRVNIVVCANNMRLVSDKATWNFSGCDGASAPQSPPSTSSNPSENGEDGKDGDPGQSGGNVMILVRDTVSGPGHLNVTSNGGNGGHGQHGGNGSDGKNGIDGDTRCPMTMAQFKDYFPTGSKFLGVSAEAAVQKSSECLKRLAKGNAVYSLPYESYHRYQKVTTPEGAEAGFSFWNGLSASWIPLCGTRQAYGWFVGAPGTEGTIGGKPGRPGRGGMPGYPGSIHLDVGSYQNKDMIAISNAIGVAGGQGGNGSHGRAGTNGKCGTDFAFVDPLLIVGYATDPVYYSGRLVKRMTSESRSDAAFCEGEKKYVYFETVSNERPSLRTEFLNQNQEQSERSPVRDSQKQSSILESSMKHAFQEMQHQSTLSTTNLDQNNNAEIEALHQQAEKRLSMEKQKISELSSVFRICDNWDKSKDDKRFKRNKFSGKVPDIHKSPGSSPLSLLAQNVKSEVEESKSEMDPEGLITLNNFLTTLLLIAEDYVISLPSCQSLLEEISNLENLIPGETLESIEDNLVSRYRFGVLNEIAIKGFNLAEIPLRSILIPSESVHGHYGDDGLTLKVFFPVVEVSEIVDKIRSQILETTAQQSVPNASRLSSMYSKAKSTAKSLFQRNQDNSGPSDFLLAFKRTIGQHSWESFPYLQSIWDEWVSSHENLWKNNPSTGAVSKDHFFQLVQSVVFNEPQGGSDLEQILHIYNKLKDDEMFPVYDVIKELTVIDEFADMIMKCGVSLVDAEVLALACKVQVEIYAFPEESDDHTTYDYDGFEDLKVIHTFNNQPPAREVKVIKFLINEDSSLTLLQPQTVLDRKCLRQTILKVISDLDRTSTCDDFDKYLNNTLPGNSTSRLWSLSEDFDTNREEERSAETSLRLVKSISSCFPEESKSKAVQILTGVAEIGHKVLEALYRRFKWEGCRIPKELVTQICLLVCEDDQLLTCQIIWMINSVPQNIWNVELALMEIHKFLDFSYQTPINSWREEMKKLPNKSVLDIFVPKLVEENVTKLQQESFCQQVTELLEDLSSISISLDDFLELHYAYISDWKYKLNQLSAKATLRSVMGEDNIENFTTTWYYILSLQNEYGVFVDQIMEMLERLIRTNADINGVLLVDILSKYYHGTWLVPEKIDVFRDFGSIEEWHKDIDKSNKSMGQHSSRKITDIISIIQRDKNNTVLPITLESIQMTLSGNYKPSIFSRIIRPFGLRKQDVTDWSVNCIQKTDVSFGEMLYYIDEGVNLLRKFRLRYSQKIAVLAALQNPRNILSQVATGEGKSLIVVVWSIIKALGGEDTDIVTSSSVLAIRDAQVNEDIYKLFGVTVGHNASNDLEERKAAYHSQVVYGDASSFQRDYLLDKYYGKNTLGRRSDLSKVNVMIDEVDSMLLDKGNNVLYLSHQPGGLESLDSLFIYIWQAVNYMVASGKLPTAAELKAFVIKEIYTIIPKEEFRLIDEACGHEIHSYLIRHGVIEESGKVSEDKAKIRLPDKLKAFQDRTEYLIRKHSSRERAFAIPSYLKPFVEIHVEAWVESAFRAIQMTQDREYVVDTTSKSHLSIDTTPNIIIVDRDTGVDMCQSQWNDGLHQFLQLKHQCKLSALSLKSIFISNITYFKRYKRIHGLTGTLGSQVERDFLQNTYNVDFMNVPMAMQKKFTEQGPIIRPTKEEWRDAIVKKALEHKIRRSVLIICESIADVDYISSGFEKTDSTFVYKRSYEKFNVTSEQDPELSPGKVIVATNLAGRGTDIKITKELDKNGGLFIILAYLPDSIRVEQQAFGRAARNGQNGSGQLIVLDPGYAGGNSQLQIVELKMDRDEQEIETISQIQKKFKNVVALEEELFDNFSTAFVKLQNVLGSMSTNMSKFILNCCLDKWAFWLDSIGDSLKNSEDKSQLLRGLSKLKLRLEKIKNYKDAFELAETPSQLVTVGKYYLEDRSADEAIKYFDKVILKELHFAAGAWYYKAVAWARKTYLETEDNLQKFRVLLLKAEKEFSKLIQQEMMKVSTIKSISEQLISIPTNTFIQADSFEEQRNNTIGLYQHFIQSIRDILGPTVNKDSLKTTQISDDGVASELLSYFCQIGKLRDISVTAEHDQVFTEEDYSSVSHQYGVGHKLFQKALNENRSANSFSEIISTLKSDIDLPNKDKFWRSLGSIDAVEHAKWVLTISNREALEECQSYKQLSKEEVLSGICEINGKGKVFFRSIPPGDKIMVIELREDPSKWSSKSKELLKELESKEYLQVNRIGTWNKGRMDTKNIPLESKYNRINFDAAINSFVDSGFPKDIQGVFSHLVDEGLLDKVGLLLHLNGERVKWDMYEIYKDHVLDAIVTQCVYRRLALEMESEAETNEEDHLHTKIAEDPHTTLAHDMLSAGILQEIQLHPNYESVSTNPKIMTLEDIQCFFKRRKICENPENFWIYMTEQGWLVNQGLIDLVGVTASKLLGFKRTQFRPLKLQLPSDLTLESLQVPWNTKNMLDYLKMRSALCSKKEEETVTKSLVQFKPKLQQLEGKQIDGNLESLDDTLDENTQFKSFLEINTLKLSGLDSIITLGEAKWTWTMIIKTTLCLLFGILQIVAGIALEIFSVGAGTYWASVVISEGISDIFYSVQCFSSGVFSLDDYLQHKWKSVIFSCATAGIGQWLGAGAKVSKYGIKLAGSTGAISKLSGMELIKEVGWKAVLKKARDSLGYKVLTGLSHGVATYAVSKGVECLVSKFCQQLGDNICGDLSKQISEIGLREVLETIYVASGAQEGMRMVVGALNKIMSMQAYRSHVESNISAIAGSVIQGVAEGVGKGQTASGSDIQKVLSILNTLMILSKYVVTMQSIFEVTRQLLSKMKADLSNVVANLKTSNPESKNKTEKKIETMDFEAFERDVRSNLQSNLKTQIGDIIQHQLITPLCQSLAVKAITKIGRAIRAEYRSVYQARIKEKFRELQKERPDGVGSSGEHEKDRSVVLDECNIQKQQEYYAKLRSLEKRCTDPELLAEMVMEGGPLGYIAVQAASNRYGIQIQVEGLEGFEHPDVVNPSTPCNKSITLELKDYHFSSSADASGSTGDQDCLCRALSEKLGRDISPQELRKELADQIRKDEQIKYIMKNQWHRVYLDKGGYGGGLKPDLQKEANKLKSDPGLKKPDDWTNYIGIYGAYEVLKSTVSTKKNHEADHFPPKCLLKQLLPKKLQEIYRQEYPDSPDLPKATGTKTANEVLIDKIWERQATINLPYSQHKKVSSQQRDVLTKMKGFAQEGKWDKVYEENLGIYQSTIVKDNDNLLRYTKPGVENAFRQGHRWGILNHDQYQDLLRRTANVPAVNLPNTRFKENFNALKSRHENQIGGNRNA